MKNLYPTTAIAFLFMLFSCGSETEETSSTEEVKEDICFYSYDSNAGVKVKWTAFKTNEKVGVGGEFKQANVMGGEKSTKISDVLQSIKFNIPTESTYTSNEERDAKIVEHFFGAMEKTDLIIGQVKEVAGDNTKGTCSFYLTLNDIEKEVTLDYNVNDATITLTGEIDVTNWGAEGAIESINKTCEALHTGSDGVSKTWPNVELEIETTFKKDCH